MQNEIKEVKNNTETRFSILDMGMGAFKERADYEMAKIIENIADINVPANKKRSLILQIDIVPDENRVAMKVECLVKSKLIPTAPVSTMLFASPDNEGEVAYKEAVRQAPGQIDVFGGVQEKPKVLNYTPKGA